MAEAAKLRHLFRRAGFGARPVEIAAYRDQDLPAVVADLLDVPAEPETIAPPVLSKPEFNPERLADMQAIWLHRMATTRYPLVEKMTLFWHGHFATGIKKVGKAVLMQTQNDLLRRHSLGSFGALLQAMGTDPAMLIWLDGNGSTRRAPNENYAREVMELFTTGPGPYTEADVKAAARALTGWRVDKDTFDGTFKVTFSAQAFDPGVKQFLGQSGKFTAADIAGILARRPETAKFLAAKLWRFFASPVPDAATVDAMADAYLRSGGEIKEVLKTLFLADAFYSDSVVNSQVKSPAEFVAGSLRLLGLPGSREAASLCTRMGQTLYDPPNVAGWQGGAAWLGASSLLTRWNFGEAVRLWLGAVPRADLPATAASPTELVDAWLAQFGINPVSHTTREALLKLVGDRVPADGRARWEVARTLARTVVAAPEYQFA
ncbi:MAG TPA: DUF1800 domain-containing protein [Symbiobacteriaceae bacterium]|jgi:uncharacterized protein (DUF1800 family)